MSNADLCMLVTNLVGFINRDATEFLVYSVAPADITAFENLGNEYEIFPTDEEYLADVMIATETKEAKADELRIAIRSVSVRAETKFGANSGKYRKFAVVGMNQLNDRDLLICARHVVHVGGLFLSELGSEGLTQPILDSLLATAQEFEDSLFALTDAIADRDIKTEERITKGNELYSLVSKYCNFGKQIWGNVSEAKYNDYVIYTGGATGLPGKIQNLIYTEATNALTWTADPTATTYQVEISSDGSSDWTLEYEDVDAEARIAKDPGTWYARCRGINDKGNGAWSDVLEYFIPIRKPVITDCVYQSGNNRVVVLWQPVPYVDYFEVWQSIVATGLPAGDYTKVAEPVTSPYYHISPTAGNREYYYIIGKNTPLGMESEPSDVVFVEIPV